MDWPRHIRAGVMAVRGQHALAATEYRRVLESDPGDPAALIAVLGDCRTRGDVAEAIAAADRALARDATNFIALDGLAWAYLEQGDHHQAKAAVQSAIKALDDLDKVAAFRGLPRVMIAAMRLFFRLPGLRKRYPRLRSTSEMEGEAARGIAEWRAWALEYLAWYDRENGSEPMGAQP